MPVGRLSPACLGAEAAIDDSIVYTMTAGLEEAVVTKAIDANHSTFDTSAEGLLVLRKASVSEGIIQGMLKQAGQKLLSNPCLRSNNAGGIR